MRGKAIPQRKINPDPKYNRLDLAKFINYIMRRGKKSIAQKIVYGAFEYIEKTANQDALKVYERAFKNVGPSFEIRGRRIGGANYQIPFPVNEDRRLTLSLRWIITAAKSRKGKAMAEALALEIMDAAKGEGSAIKKKEDTHRMAEANKAFAHFARFTKKKK